MAKNYDDFNKITESIDLFTNNFLDEELPDSSTAYTVDELINYINNSYNKVEDLMYE